MELIRDLLLNCILFYIDFNLLLLNFKQRLFCFHAYLLKIYFEHHYTFYLYLIRSISSLVTLKNKEKYFMCFDFLLILWFLWYHFFFPTKLLLFLNSYAVFNEPSNVEIVENSLYNSVK